jgi:hypothetical protein
MSQITEEQIEFEELEELLDHAEESLTGVILATVAFCKARGIPVADWVAFVGDQVAPSWSEVEGKGAADVARLVALKVMSAGGVVHALSGDDAKADLEVTWPEAEDLEVFGLTRADVEPISHVYERIAAHLGLSFQTGRSGDNLLLTFSR